MSAVAARPPETASHGPAAVHVDGGARSPSAFGRDARHQWQQLTDTVARRAQKQALAVPGVRSAHFTVAGTPAEPAVQASVSIRQGAAFAEAVDAVMENVVPAMEMALGRAFTANTIDFSVHGLGIASGGAATLSIV